MVTFLSCFVRGSQSHWLLLLVNAPLANLFTTADTSHRNDAVRKLVSSVSRGTCSLPKGWSSSAGPFHTLTHCVIRQLKCRTQIKLYMLVPASLQAWKATTGDVAQLLEHALMGKIHGVLSKCCVVNILGPSRIELQTRL